MLAQRIEPESLANLKWVILSKLGTGERCQDPKTQGQVGRYFQGKGITL